MSKQQRRRTINPANDLPIVDVIQEFIQREVGVEWSPMIRTQAWEFLTFLREHGITVTREQPITSAEES